jgi:hypothetical protein
MAQLWGLVEAMKKIATGTAVAAHARSRALRATGLLTIAARAIRAAARKTFRNLMRTIERAGSGPTRARIVRWKSSGGSWILSTDMAVRLGFDR